MQIVPTKNKLSDGKEKKPAVTSVRLDQVQGKHGRAVLYFELVKQTFHHQIGRASCRERV